MIARAAILLGAMGLAAAAATGPAATAAPAAKAAPRDWSRTVVSTPEGGFRMGNPNARVKLVEYGSLVCPHCADFAGNGMPPLVAGYVRTGKASLEYRHYLLNAADFAAVLLARCGGAQRFFPIAEGMYRAQPQWLGKLGALGPAEADQINGLPIGQRLGRLADASGLTRIAAAGGVAPAAGKKCLADQAALDRLVDMTEAAEKLGVYGTPTFFINGARAHAGDWTTLEPLIRRAAG